MRLKSSHLSFVFLGTFLGIVFLLQWWVQPTYPLPLWIFLGILAFWSLLGCMHALIRPAAASLLACVLGIIFAVNAVAHIAHEATPATVDFYAPANRVRIRGVITEEPDRRPLQTKYTVAAESIQIGTGKIMNVQGRVLATDRSGWPQFSYGDDVMIAGKLDLPGTIEDFHYDRYLSRYDIYSVMYRARMTKTGEGRRNAFFAFLFDRKAAFEAQINRLFPEPHASLLAGLLTGSRRGIPDSILKDFQTTGLTHLIAISGFNITIVLAVILGALFFLPLRLRFFPAVATVIAFTFFVGAGASVVRAAIMGILGLFALQVHRQTDARLLILWTAFAMLLWNPAYLWYDAGFQLSFLAILGLTELSPLLERGTRWLPDSLGIRESMQMTLAAQLFAVPLIILLFGTFSIVAPFANILVAPAVPLAMLFGFLGTVLSYVWFPLGQAVSFLAFGCLEWMLAVPRLLATLPFSSVNVSLHRSIIALYYTVLIILILWLRPRMVPSSR